jgi:hypothetical protein
VSVFFDIHHRSLNKDGEELCGDHVKIVRTEDKVRMVLSDGLGSGVKANILATLTSEIIATMLREGIALEDVLETIIGTLPICQVRHIAYATFTIIEIDRVSLEFTVMNFDNPPVFFFRSGEIVKLEKRVENILGREISIWEGRMERGDFLGLISDGVWYAGLGRTYNFGWGWDQIAAFMSRLLQQPTATAQTVVEGIIRQTSHLYEGAPGDDATLVGLYLRRSKSAVVFTGPPLDKSRDRDCVERMMAYEGRKIVCGGTTGNLVARQLGVEINTLVESMRREIPPLAICPGVDLMTEGILTLAKATEIIGQADGDLNDLPEDANGAVLLALELLVADEIHFMVGRQINPFYQNPLLPSSVSIRVNLIDRLAALLRTYQKEVSIEYC